MDEYACDERGWAAGFAVRGERVWEQYYVAGEDMGTRQDNSKEEACLIAR